MSGMQRSAGEAVVRVGLMRENSVERDVPSRKLPSRTGDEGFSSKKLADTGIWRRQVDDKALDNILVGLESAICQLIESQDEASPDTERYLLRKAKRIRQMNSQCEALFGKQFQNAPMNMLLELFVCSACGEKTLVKNLCLASSVSQSTALRWIGRLADLDLITRCGDDEDARRSLIELTPKGREALSRFLSAT